MTITCFLQPLLLLSVLSAVVIVPVRSAGAALMCSACPGDLNDDGQVSIDEIVTVVNAALEGCPPVGPSSSLLLQTGQTMCDQGDGTLGACPGTPPGQDAAVGAGMPTSYRDNGDGTIRDNVTGLVWEKLANDGEIHDWSNFYTWYDAIDVKIAALNREPCFAGHCDWRLPNRRELDSLVDTGRVAPAIDPAFDTGCQPGCTATTCSCTQSKYYWSSTTYEDVPTFAWAVDANAGIVNAFNKRIVKNYARAVRTGGP